MREIKFRGKSKRDGEWFYGNYYDKDTKGNTHILTLERGCLVIDPETVGQFTGLTDKNGQEIYEDDIVECVSWNEYFSKGGQPIEPFRRKMYIDFRKGAFVMVEPMPEPLSDNEWSIIYDGDIIVIGNIYDNPELIKRH